MPENSFLFLFAAISALASLLQIYVLLFGSTKRQPKNQTQTMKQLSSIRRRLKWAFGVMAISLSLSVLGFYKSLHSVPAFDASPKLEQVYQRRFMNEEVKMDGKEFSHCRFENVKFVYEGRRMFSIHDCQFVGTRVISLGRGLAGLVALQKALGSLPDNVILPDELSGVEAPRFVPPKP